VSILFQMENKDALHFRNVWNREDETKAHSQEWKIALIEGKWSVNIFNIVAALSVFLGAQLHIDRRHRCRDSPSNSSLFLFLCLAFISILAAIISRCRISDVFSWVARAEGKEMRKRLIFSIVTQTTNLRILWAAVREGEKCTAKTHADKSARVHY
jgi:hypothetical protein